MVDVLLMILIVGGLALFIYGICKAVTQVAAHVQGHPEAGKALFEHLFVPLFGGKKEPPGKDQVNPN
jgi:hypothetical protein